MRRIILFSLLCTLLLAGCASSGPNVSAMTSPGVDLTSFETFNYLPRLGTDRSNGARTPLAAQPSYSWSACDRSNTHILSM